MGGTQGGAVQSKFAFDVIGGAVNGVIDHVKDEAKRIYDITRSGKLPEVLLEADRRMHPKDRSVPSFSVYIEEELGIQKQLDKELDKSHTGTGQIMGVFVPPAVKATDKVNVIFYIHGDKVRNVPRSANIQEYWNLPDFPLREGLKDSGRPYVLVAPTLGQDSDTQFGNLGAKIDDHLDNVMLQLFRYGPPDFAPPKPPQVGDIILAGHSGAFGSMSSILHHMKRYKSNVKEIWGFDVAYAKLHLQLAASKVPVYAYFVDTPVKSRLLAAAKNPSVFVMEGIEFFMEKGKEKSRGIKHDHLVRKFWADRLRRMGSNGMDPDDKKRMVKG